MTNGLTNSDGINNLIRGVWRLDRSPALRGQNVKNATYSLVEYAVILLLYLAVTPLLVRRLDLDVYGIWILTNSIVGLASALDFGFGDATTWLISRYRGRSDSNGIIRGVRTAYWASIPLAIFSGSILFLCAQGLVTFVFKIPTDLSTIATQSLKLAGALLSVRVMGSVFAGTIRGYERYDVSAVVSICTQGAIQLSTVILVLIGLGITEILLASVLVSLIGLVTQGEIVRRLMQSSPWRFEVDKRELQEMFRFGRYSWLQSVIWMVFTHADRLVIGASLGTSALAIYAVCLQLAQQINAVMGAVFSILLPAISRLMETTEVHNLRGEVTWLIRLNLACSLVLAFPVIVFGDFLLMVWMGHDFMVQGTTILRLLAGAFFIQSAQVALHFILIGAGDFKFVSIISLIGITVNILTMILLMPLMGINAAAMGRLMYGSIISVNFFRIGKVFR